MIDAVEAAFSGIAVLFRAWFVHAADRVLALPYVSGFIRVLFVYTFAQALGLLWGFIIIVLQALSRQLVEWLLSDVDSEVSSLPSAAALVAQCYACLSTLRMIVLAAGGLWTMAWEASNDFPTVQRLLLKARLRGAGVPSTCAVLTIPLAIITLAFAASGAAPVLCGEAGACGSGWLAEQLLTADGRGNRMLRFSLVIMILQWAQLFEALSPIGLLGLCRAAPTARKAFLVALLPVSLARFSQFVLRPEDHVVSGSVHALVPALGLSRHAYDNLLAVVWGAWLIMAINCAPASQAGALGEDVAGATGAGVPRGKSAPAVAGGAASGEGGRESCPEVWRQLSMRFQTMFVISALGYWVRSFLSPGIGWTFAQEDLMALCTFYPAMSILVWSATYVAVSLWRARPHWAVATALLGATLGVGARPAAKWGLACAHLLRQVLKALGERSVSYAVNRHTAQWAGRVEWRWARGLVQCMAFILVAWFAILSALALLASTQQRLGLYPGRMEFSTGGPKGEAALRIGHHAIIGSYLTLWPEPTGRPPPNTYGICNQTWGGLGVLDYALLSLAAYWDGDDPELTKVLAHLFPASRPSRAVLANSSRPPGRPGGGGMPWIEVALPGLGGARVIAVRGTDPTRIDNVVEDIRMWTEPVVLAMLALIFPTIRAWPRQLVDNWVATTHGLLAALGLRVGPWMYEPLTEHLRTFGAGAAPWLTGHSLGGSIAQVVAALEGAGVVAISPPGLLESFAKHGRRQGRGAEAGGPVHAVHRRSVSVVVEGDWVSRFDAHAGFVQTVACDRGDLSAFGGCHLVENTICHLLTACGDMHHRWQRCEHSFEPHLELASLAAALPAQVLGAVRGWSQSISSNAALIALCAATAAQLLVLDRVLASERRPTSQ